MPRLARSSRGCGVIVGIIVVGVVFVGVVFD
jgi:hypothetical protein